MKLVIFQKEVENLLAKHKQIYKGQEPLLKYHEQVNMSLRAIAPMLWDLLENPKDWRKDLTFEDVAIMIAFIRFLWALGKQKMGKHTKEQALREFNQIKKVLQNHGIQFNGDVK